MIRFSIAFFSLILAPRLLFAQVGNEWIQFNQPYYKIPVAKDGFYRLSSANLQAAGVPSSVDPRKLQLFHRGVEQAIHVEGQNDGQLHGGDYLEFFGRRNDGSLDTKLYKNAGAQPHSYHNLYNDTTSYFLTIGSLNGKRISVSSLSGSGLTAETFHWDERLLVLSNDYSGGLDYGSIQSSAFEDAEGWMGPRITQNQEGSYMLEGITSGVTSIAPVLEILLIGRGPMNHVVEIYAGTRLLNAAGFTGYSTHKQTEQLQWADVSSDGKITIKVKVLGLGGAPDRVSVGYIKITYPQQTNMASASEKLFTLVGNADNKSYLTIQNPAAGARVYDITDPANLIQLATNQTTTLNTVVGGTGSARKIFATATSITPSIKRVSFRQINPASHNFVIITHPILRKPASGYTDPVKAYAEYRALQVGGGYDTLIVNIQQLYDQFSYGEQTPVAIFHFVKFLSAVNAPKYLFLIGKGLEVNYNYYRNPAAFTVYKDLVPTAGYPGSDMFFSAVNGTTPTIATGRLTASVPQDVAAYFNKVKEFEALPYNDQRRKNILHLSGGIYQGEPEIFRSYLEGFAQIAKGYQLGGYVKAVAKKSIDIQVINVSDEVNRGLNLITFFGHSSSTSLDFDIGFVTDPVMGYNNKGKYPVILMNGCSAGSFFLQNSIFGENWVNTPNRGAIGVIAHSSLAFAFALQRYSTMFYEVGYQDPASSNRGLGDIQKEIAARYLEAYGVSPVTTTQVHQMVLLGDPSVKLFGAPKADYEIPANTVSIQSFNDEPVTALSDSFKLTFVVHNYGKAIDQDFKVKITRTLNDNSKLTYDSTFEGILYSDTITFALPGKVENGFGNNTFTVYIDALDQVEELNEDNNTAAISFFIPLSGTKNLYPQDFAIVNSKQVNLTFQHTDQISGEREFLMELDTIPTFSSPFKKQFSINATVLGSQKIALSNEDTTAYYWRTKLAKPTAEENTAWDISSFTYIPNGPSGWTQVHFPQYANNPAVGIVKDTEIRQLKFQETISDIAVRTFGAAAGKPGDSVSVKINGAEYNLYTAESLVCRNNTINLIAFDRTTTQPYAAVYLTWIDILQKYGGRSLICGREPYAINSFLQNELVTTDGADLIRYVDNVALGDSVILFNIGDAGYSAWPAQAKTKLGEIGISASQINDLQAGEAVIIFARKGAAPGSARMVKASTSPANQQKITVDATITGRFRSGTMTSGLIGPAQQWNNFFTRYKETDTSDETVFDVIGVKSNGEEAVLKINVTNGEDLSSIYAGEYPYVKVLFKATDDVFVTPSQLYRWMVTYEPVAEGLLLYRGSNKQQTLFKGQRWNGNYSFINISAEAFTDSLSVRYGVKNSRTFVATTNYIKIQAPLPGDTTHFTVPFETTNEGENNADVFVNPRVLPEISYDNNIISLNRYLNVLGDLTAPILDVTIDGRHITRDEFISLTPKVKIMLWDNNPYLFKKDTVGMALLLAYPCEEDPCGFRRIYFSSPEISWQSETDTSEFLINFNPTLSNGRYVLRVEGKDANGNPSGIIPYEVSFQVKEESEVMVRQAYPNPFNDATHFEFTVTGQQPPTSFRLSISNLSGKPVHEFAETNSNHFFIGTNTVQWKAIDASGAPLPNGMYIYSITIHLGDSVITKVGKVVLAR